MIRNMRLAQRAPVALPSSRRLCVVTRATAEPATGTKAKVSFTLPHHVEFGQEVALVGELETLGRSIHQAGKNLLGCVSCSCMGRNASCQCCLSAPLLKQGLWMMVLVLISGPSGNPAWTSPNQTDKSWYCQRVHTQLPACT